MLLLFVPLEIWRQPFTEQGTALTKGAEAASSLKEKFQTTQTTPSALCGRGGEGKSG